MRGWWREGSMRLSAAPLRSGRRLTADSSLLRTQGPVTVVKHTPSSLSGPRPSLPLAVAESRIPPSRHQPLETPPSRSGFQLRTKCLHIVRNERLMVRRCEQKSIHVYASGIHIRRQRLISCTQVLPSLFTQHSWGIIFVEFCSLSRATARLRGRNGGKTFPQKCCFCVLICSGG